MYVQTHVALFTANGVWIAPNNLLGLPAGYTWGESGTAGTSSHGIRSGAGSGAGAFGGEPAWSGIVPGSVVTVTVPQGSTGNPTTLTAAGAATIQANAGLAPVTTTGGLGGTAGTNTIAFAGGPGANAISGTSTDAGAGGGSAGSTSAGGAASTSTGGTAGTGAAGPPSLAGVAGQNGPGALAAGLNGAAPGGGASGGGGGGAINHTGGSGARGQALIIWQTLELFPYSRGVPNAHTGRSSSSRGAPVVGAATSPAPFVLPKLSTRGQLARRGRVVGPGLYSAGSPVIPPAPHPSPFVLPKLSTRGQLARRGSSSSSRGAPVRTRPAPFVLPKLSTRGQLARRGRVVGPGLYSAGSPVVPPPVIPALLIALASAAGTDDYGNAYPQGIFASAGVIEGPTIIGSNAFYYSPSPGFGNLTQSVTTANGTDQYGNAFIGGTATYNNAGSFWSAVVISGGTVDWYKASTAAGPWTFEAEIGFDWNNLTGGGLILNAPAGLSGTVGGIPFQIPVNTPAANSGAIIAALQLAGIFL